MKLLRHRPPGQEGPGLVHAQGRIHDVSGSVQEMRLGIDGPGGQRQRVVAEEEGAR